MSVLSRPGRLGEAHAGQSSYAVQEGVIRRVERGG
jgi:hypothetical protein